MNRDDINPMVRIAEALESIAESLEKLSSPALAAKEDIYPGNAYYLEKV